MPLKYASYPQIPSITHPFKATCYSCYYYVQQVTRRRTVRQYLTLLPSSYLEADPTPPYFLPISQPSNREKLAVDHFYLCPRSLFPLLTTPANIPLICRSGPAFHVALKPPGFCLRVPSRAECYFAWSRGGRVSAEQRINGTASLVHSSLLQQGKCPH